MNNLNDLNQKLIVVSSSEEAKRHGYTGWLFIYQKVGIFVNADTELCEYDKYLDITVFSIKDYRIIDDPSEKVLCFYEVSTQLKPLVADALMMLTEFTDIEI